MKNRFEGLVAQLEVQELDGMLISTPENRRYLSGFRGSAGFLLITKSERYWSLILVTLSRP
ncbi:MAG: hypothetical protein Ct9H300mP11_16640 [Chloroflexota bacterium]|nr:MAG: hypothetical protein Ct9H300mP11_16640 [Chloroflexota bacterium]